MDFKTKCSSVKILKNTKRLCPYRTLQFSDFNIYGHLVRSFDPSLYTRLFFPLFYHGTCLVHVGRSFLYIRFVRGRVRDEV